MPSRAWEGASITISRWIFGRANRSTTVFNVSLRVTEWSSTDGEVQRELLSPLPAATFIKLAVSPPTMPPVEEMCSGMEGVSLPMDSA